MGKKKGFTLVELVVVVALLGVVIALAYNIWNGMQKSYKEQKKITEAQGNARNAIHLMINKMKRADEFIDVGGGTLHTNISVTGPNLEIKKSSTARTVYSITADGKIVEDEYNGGGAPVRTELVNNVDSFQAIQSAGKINITIKIKDTDKPIEGEYVQRAGIEN